MPDKRRTIVAISVWVATAVAYFLIPESVRSEGWRALVILGAAAVAALVTWAADALVRRASQLWPMASGYVESSSVIVDPDRGALLPRFLLDTAYSYVAAGERYSGSYQRHFWRESSADSLAKTLKGTQVIIRYNPRKPDQSVLDRSMNHPI